MGCCCSSHKNNGYSRLIKIDKDQTNGDFDFNREMGYSSDDDDKFERLEYELYCPQSRKQ